MRTRALALAAFLLLAAMGCPKPEPQPPMLPGIFEACEPLELTQMEPEVPLR